LVGEGVQPNKEFDLRNRVNRTRTMNDGNGNAQQRPPMSPATPASPTMTDRKSDRRPIISSPNAPGSVGRQTGSGNSSRDRHFNQPATEKPGSLIMRDRSGILERLRKT